MPPDYCFPARLEEIDVLESAMARRPQDARAPYYYGNLLYDKRRYEDAIGAWRRAARLDPTFPTSHRNLGLAEFNVLGRREEALACYGRAFAAAPTDARVLYELDQLRHRCGVAPVERGWSRPSGCRPTCASARLPFTRATRARPSGSWRPRSPARRTSEKPSTFWHLKTKSSATWA